MACPHSQKPGPCSQCIPDAPVQRVTIAGPVVLVDGKPVEEPEENEQQRYSRRGGHASPGKRKR